MYGKTLGAMVLVAAGALAGCAPGVTLRNSMTGDVADCRSPGGVSDEIKAQMLRQCLDDYRNRGYKVVASGNPQVQPTDSGLATPADVVASTNH